MATDPFRSERLIYRAVDTHRQADAPLFAAINNDRAGYVNSNAQNVALPGQADNQRYMKYVSEDTLLGAVVCLPATLIKSEDYEKKEHEETGVDQKTVRTLSEKKEDEETNIDQKHVDSLPEAGTPIGVIHLSRLSPAMTHHRNTEIGIDILPAYQGKGYGSEAITWVLDYAFRRVGLHRVSVRAFEWNKGAVRLYERMGFKHEGRGRETLWHEGKWWDGIEMGMLDREWWEMQKAKNEKRPTVEPQK